MWQIECCSYQNPVERVRHEACHLCAAAVRGEVPAVPRAAGGAVAAVAAAVAVARQVHGRGEHEARGRRGAGAAVGTAAVIVAGARGGGAVARGGELCAAAN